MPISYQTFRCKDSAVIQKLLSVAKEVGCDLQSFELNFSFDGSRPFSAPANGWETHKELQPQRPSRIGEGTTRGLMQELN